VTIAVGFSQRGIIHLTAGGFSHIIFKQIGLDLKNSLFYETQNKYISVMNLAIEHKTNFLHLKDRTKTYSMNKFQVVR